MRLQSKKCLTTKCAPKVLFFTEKKYRKTPVIFHLENSLWNVYNQGGWLILCDLLKEWVAKRVACDVIEFNED